MHVRTLLNENATEREDVLKLIQAIAKSADFFRQRKSDDEWLYRGISFEEYSETDIVREITPRLDRRPRDINQFLHTRLDDWFLAHFGVKYRSQGVFATGSQRIAEEYGNGVIVLPQGPFKFCWGEHISDALHDFDMHRAYQWMALTARQQGEDIPYLKQTGLRSAGGESGMIEFLSDSLLGPLLFDDWVDDTAKHAGYKSTDLSAAIRSQNEIMIRCGTFAAVPINFNVTQEHVDAAESLLKMTLEIPFAPTMTEFLNGISKVYSRAL